MNLLKAQKVKLSEHFDELWLQNQIEADPTILGLGDVVVLRRERRQSSGGRLDFLLHDPETETLYELEIQLGSTDESHIIRTIEYWDIESRKNPSKEHPRCHRCRKYHEPFFQHHLPSKSSDSNNCTAARCLESRKRSRVALHKGFGHL
jgi:hypothetical protein